MKHSILYIIVIVIAILFTSCLGSKKTAIPEQVSTDPLSDNLGSAKGIDTGIVAQYAQLIAENHSLCDSLKTGKIESDFYSFADTVPTILYKVFPQLIFAKMKKIGAGYPGYSRGWVYYNNTFYMIDNEFNYLLRNMKYISMPTLSDKSLALVVILENFNESVNITNIENVTMKYGSLDEVYNYRIHANIDNHQEEYLIFYNNEQFERIVKTNISDYKTIRPAIVY